MIKKQVRFAPMPTYRAHPYDSVVPGEIRGQVWGYDPDFPECVPEVEIERLTYPDADYVCLQCEVEPDCDPHSPLCKWKRLHHRAMGPHAYEIVHAIEVLEGRATRVCGASIARVLNRTRSGIHGRIKRVAEMGLIVKEGSKSGARIHLTEAGRAYLAEHGE